MDLYEVKAPGLRSSALNSREISQLFRNGRLYRDAPCKRKGEATWRTIDQLFPLLKYSPEIYSLPAADQQPKRRRLALIAAAFTLLGAGVVFYLR